MLRKKYNKKLGRSMYALVSTSKPGKVLRWFGSGKPSEGSVAKEEARVNWFKHHG
jgi:hypothetical protein